MSWNQRLAGWTGRSSDNEDAKRQRTEQQIREAIRSHARLSSQPLKIYAKGSYANNTNVRLDSDVDICVEYYGGFHYDGVGERDDQISKAAAGISDYTGPYTQFGLFKSDVENALRAVFGSAVSRSNKCIRIRGGDTTLPADVVPCWEHRTYYQRGYSADYYQGTILFPDQGVGSVVNYPQQHLDNGVAKNNRTGRRYKRTVRALKRLENEMVQKEVIKEVPSYLIECLVYRCPDRSFSLGDYEDIARTVLAGIHQGTDGPEPSDEDDRWLEVNDIKFLFHPAQSWDRAQANKFALDAWTYMGFN